METPASAEETVEVVRSLDRVQVVGAGSKTTTVEGNLSTVALTGVIAYEPGEYTITAAAGTPVHEIEHRLAEHGQYLPFDPMRVQAGATLGGTVAAAAHGPGRIRFGGVRDFLLEVRMVDGSATLVSGGGRVVKNAAGFDLPKLMVGSRGSLGVLVELTFKVFPRPVSWCSLRIRSSDTDTLLSAQRWLIERAYDFAGLELELNREANGTGEGELWLRLAGMEGVAQERAALFAERLTRDPVSNRGLRVEMVAGEEEEAFWTRARELDSGSGSECASAWIRLATRPSQVEIVERLLQEAGLGGCQRRWSGGALSLWLATRSEETAQIEPLDQLLAAHGLAGQVFLGSQEGRALGTASAGSGAANPFGERLRLALDPEGRFVP